MAYDADTTNPGDETAAAAMAARRTRAHPKDLESIVCALECAAVLLSPDADSTFSEARLIEQAIELGGSECPFERRDLTLVLDRLRSVKPLGGGLYRLA